MLQKEELFNSNILTSNIANELLNYWEEKLNSLSTLNIDSYFDYFFFFFSMKENILAAIIYDHTSKKIVSQYGLSNIFSETAADVSVPISGSNEIKIYKDQKVQICKASFQRSDKLKHYTILVVAPAGINIQPYWHKLRHIFYIYYIFKFVQCEAPKILYLFKTINKNVIDAINTLIDQQKFSCLTYFKFDPLKNYTKLMGENFIFEVERYLSNSIREKITENDQLYILSPQDYLLISLGSTDEILKEKFHKVSFQVKGLLITYRIKFFLVQNKISDLASIWDEVTIY